MPSLIADKNSLINPRHIHKTRLEGSSVRCNIGAESKTQVLLGYRQHFLWPVARGKGHQATQLGNTIDTVLQDYQ